MKSIAIRQVRHRKPWHSPDHLRSVIQVAHVALVTYYWALITAHMLGYIDINGGLGLLSFIAWLSLLVVLCAKILWYFIQKDQFFRGMLISNSICLALLLFNIYLPFKIIEFLASM